MENSVKWWSINGKLLPVKLHFFLFMTALSSVIPFRSVFAKQLGISATEIGIIFCASTFVKIITNPLFGFILDYFKKVRLTIYAIMITVAVSHLAMVFIPPKASTHNIFSVLRNDFHTKMKYLCGDETSPSECDQKFLIYSEYGIPNSYIRNRNSFACDIRCSNEIVSINEGTVQKYSPTVIFEFDVLVNVSECETDFRVKKGDMLYTHDKDNSGPLMSLNVSGSHVKQFKAVNSDSKNCSLKSTFSTVFMKNVRNEIKNSDLLEAFNNGKKYVDNASKEKKTCYSMHEFKTNSQTNLFKNFTNITCDREFHCETKKCHLRSGEKNELILESLKDEDEFLSMQFWSVLFLTVVSTATFSAIMFLMDAVCYQVLGDRPDQYGMQRLYGTIGWGVGSLLGGYLDEAIPSESGEANYAYSFYLLTALILIDLIPLYQVKATDLKYSPNILKDVCSLFTKCEIVYKLIVVYIIGALTGFIWNYSSWFLQEIEGSSLLLGLSQTFESIFELPCFMISGWVISKIGHDHCNSITLLCLGLRYVCFVFMYNPWWSLAAAVFHGPAMGFFYASMTMYAKEKAQPGTEATMQSLLNLAFEGLGIATGSMLGGVGVDKVGSRRTFIYSAQLSALVLLINVLVSIFSTKSKKKSVEIEPSLPSCTCKK